MTDENKALEAADAMRGQAYAHAHSETDHRLCALCASMKAYDAARAKVRIDPTILSRDFKERGRILHDLDAMLTDRINRSVPVEQELLDIANGKRPLATAEDCRRMAMKLGVPTKHTKRNA